MEKISKILSEIKDIISLNSELQVTEHVSKRQRQSTFLKVVPSVFDMEFQNSVYVIVQAKERSVAVRMFTYNNKKVLNNQSTKFCSSKISSILKDIENRLLKDTYFWCPGYPESEALILPIDSILIEQLNQEIIYRSRNCARISQKLNQMCVYCLSLFDTKNDETRIVKEEQIEIVRENVYDEDIEQSKYDTDYLIQPYLEVENIKKKKRKKTDVNFEIKTINEENRKQFSCPVENCNASFKIFLGKTMQEHLSRMHGIDVENPPDHIKHTLQLNNPVDKNGITIERDPVTKRRKYKCEYENCDFVTNAITHLRHHMPMHTGEKNFCCQECGKTFKYKSDFINCRKKHKGEFNFQCSQCNKAFLTKQKLEHHTKTHTGEKPYQCPFCIFRCARPDNLNKHTKNAHGVSMKEASKLTSFDLVKEEISGNKDKNKLLDEKDGTAIDVNNDKATEIVEETVLVEVVEEICETNNDSNVLIVQTKVR